MNPDSGGAQRNCFSVVRILEIGSGPGLRLRKNPGFWRGVRHCIGRSDNVDRGAGAYSYVNGLMADGGIHPAGGLRYSDIGLPWAEIPGNCAALTCTTVTRAA